MDSDQAFLLASVLAIILFATLLALALAIPFMIRSVRRDLNEVRAEIARLAKLLDGPRSGG